MTLPLFIVLPITTALAVGLWISALNVKYRDVRYTMNFLVQFWLFATPCGLSQFLDTGAMALGPWTQSDGWRGRRLPWGVVG